MFAQTHSPLAANIVHNRVGWKDCMHTCSYVQLIAACRQKQGCRQICPAHPKTIKEGRCARMRAVAACLALGALSIVTLNAVIVTPSPIPPHAPLDAEAQLAGASQFASPPRHGVKHAPRLYAPRLVSTVPFFPARAPGLCRAVWSCAVNFRVWCRVAVSPAVDADTPGGSVLMMMSPACGEARDARGDRVSGLNTAIHDGVVDALVCTQSAAATATAVFAFVASCVDPYTQVSKLAGQFLCCLAVGSSSDSGSVTVCRSPNSVAASVPLPPGFTACTTAVLSVVASNPAISSCATPLVPSLLAVVCLVLMAVLGLVTMVLSPWWLVWRGLLVHPCVLWGRPPHPPPCRAQMSGHLLYLLLLVVALVCAPTPALAVSSPPPSLPQSPPRPSLRASGRQLSPVAMRRGTHAPSKPQVVAAEACSAGA